MADGDFKYSLYGCYQDWAVCCYSYWCYCFAIGEIAKAVGEDETTCCILSCIVPTVLSYFHVGPCAVAAFTANVREKLRIQRGIEGTFLKDFALSFFCNFCTVTQAIREIRDTRDVPEAEKLLHE